MDRFNKRTAVEIFDRYKKSASGFILKKECEKALKSIESAAYWATWLFFTYFDADLEKYIKDIATLLGQRDVKPASGRVAFVCSYLHDNGELVRHYVRALKDNNIPTKMIVIDIKSHKYINTLKDIESANNIELELIPADWGYAKTARRIADIIECFKPEKILQHFTPYEVKCLLGVTMISNIPKYNINYTDHMFWLGASLLDYNIEFRQYGCIISEEKRHITKEQMRFLPYYPIYDGAVPFEGFPFEEEGKVIIFSGGVPYKVIGDNDLYFKILDRILQENENVVAVIAAGDKIVRNKVKNMRSHSKIFMVPFRRDIYDLMNHIDILYCTYPVGGGLMTLIAAGAKRPLLSFTKEGNCVADVDGLLNSGKNSKIAYNNIDKLCDYAHRLCIDEKYRLSEGERVFSLLQTRERFGNQFIGALYGNQHVDMVEYHKFDYEKMMNNAITRARDGKMYINYLIHNDGLSVFYKYPMYFDSLLLFYIKHFLKRIFIRILKIVRIK